MLTSLGACCCSVPDDSQYSTEPSTGSMEANRSRRETADDERNKVNSTSTEQIENNEKTTEVKQNDITTTGHGTDADTEPDAVGPANTARKNSDTSVSIHSVPSTYSTSSTSAIQSAINRLQELKVNFVALDFDQTILDVHTGGRWVGTVDELFPHVRPVFVDLMRACQSSNIQIAVVTFSQQTYVVRGILDSILKDGSTKVPIRGGDRSWTYKGKGSQQGKQPHMASAVEELEHRFQVEITRESTLLIDDDPKNIRHALRNGARAIWFNPQKPHRLLPEMIKLI